MAKRKSSRQAATTISVEVEYILTHCESIRTAREVVGAGLGLLIGLDKLKNTPRDVEPPLRRTYRALTQLVARAIIDRLRSVPANQPVPTTSSLMKMLTDRVRYAIAEGNLNETAIAAFLLGQAEMGTKLAPPAVRELTRLLQQKDKRKTTAKTRAKRAREIFASLPKEDVAKGKMHCYRKIAKLLSDELSAGKATLVVVKAGTVREWLSAGD